MSEQKESEVAQVLCIVRKVFCFKIPKVETATTGWRASDWPKEAIWSGRLRIVAKGSKCTIFLEHLDKEGIFAACPYTNERTVEAVVDSSRYFVMRIVNEKAGQTALIGLGFKERTHAFDFKAALQEFESQANAKAKAAAYHAAKGTESADFRIPEGALIHVEVGGKKEGKKKKKKAVAEDAGASLSLAPPPSSGGSRRRRKKGGGEAKAAADLSAGVNELNLDF